MRTIFPTKIILISLFIQLASLQLFAQKMTEEDYKKGVWMTARMYGGQRSGEGPNWLIMDHTVNATGAASLSSKGYNASKMQPGKCFTDDADGDYSLAGGWVDCGDHVKFGQTMFYAAYTLIKAYDEWPEGYDDYYSYDYNGYQAAGDFSWEGGHGTPNGIPDILDELKYETDFFIKCARSSTIFYSQVGDGDPDHKNWVTSVAMAALPNTEGGQATGPRHFVKNPNDCPMPANCAATLAVMSRVYEKFDPAYAALCLKHAKYAYDYAKSKKGKTASAGTFYPANKAWEDDYASMCAEMYWTTGEESYKTEALALSTAATADHNWAYNYNNNNDLAAFNLAKLGDAKAKTALKGFVDYYKGNTDSNGMFTGAGNTWGALRYPANAAFIVALWQSLNGEKTIDKTIHAAVDYILGANSSNFSFVVGYERTGCTNCSSSKHPHHRNVYLVDDIMANQATMVIPEHNKQHGYLIGGKLTVPFTESVTKYEETEGGLDYSAGLVGAIAYVASRMAPIDPNKFGHPTPELGDEQTLCGSGSVKLEAVVEDWSNLEPEEQVKYKWFKDGKLIQQGNTLTEITVTEAGEYSVEMLERSSEKWKTADKVKVTASIPAVDLGSDANLCAETSKLLDAKVTGNGITYEWTKDGNTISTEQTFEAFAAGTYEVTVSASGCLSVSDNIKITSSLPEVIHDTICAAGKVNLAVVTKGTFEWYNADTKGTLLESGSSYSTSISKNTTFYLQDANSINGSVGPTKEVSSSTNNWGISDGLQMAFSVSANFAVTSMKMFVGDVYNDGAGTVTIEILDGNGNAFSPAKKFTTDSKNITTADKGKLVEFTFSDFNVEKAWGENLRIRLSAVGFNGALFFHQSGASYPYESDPAGVVSITGAYNGTESLPTSYLYFYDWKISAGSTCARTPVLGVIDPNHPDCSTEPQITQDIELSKGWNLISLNVLPASNSTEDVFALISNKVEIVKNADGFYKPTQASQLNSLKTVRIGEAYLVKMKSAATLSVTGEEPKNVKVNLAAGWNLLGYPLSTEKTVSSTLLGIWSNATTIKNFDAFKDKSSGTLNNMKPGEGYYIYMKSADVLEY